MHVSAVTVVSPSMNKQKTESPPTFGYSHPIKTMYKKGKLPTVTKGFYGEPIDPKVVTIEHLQLASSFKDKAKATTWDNVVLTSANMNQARGSKPLSDVINFQAMGEYLQQFEAYSWGRRYIEGIIKKVSELIAQGK